MFFLERLASAVHTSNLKSDPRTSYSDSDVISAAAGQKMSEGDAQRFIFSCQASSANNVGIAVAGARVAF